MSILDKKITINRRSFLKILGAAGAAVGVKVPALAAPAIAPAAVVATAGVSLAGVVSGISIAWAGAQWLGSYTQEIPAKRQLTFSMILENAAGAPKVGDEIDYTWLAARLDAKAEPVTTLGNAKFIVLSVDLQVKGPGMPLTAEITASEIA